MQDLPPPPLTISAIRADGLGSSQAVFLAVKGNPEPYLVGGAKLSKVKEKRSHRSLLLRGRHRWNEPYYVVGTGTVYRWCTGQDRVEVQVGPGKWEGMSLYRTTGGKTYNVPKAPEPGEIEPR